MIIQLRAEELTEWFVCFHTNCTTPFWSRVIPGRWKHVRAFAFSRGCDCWLFYDVSLKGTTLTIAPAGEQGNALVGQYVHGATVLRLDRIVDMSTRRHVHILRRFGFWCVPAVRHLLGLPGGALLPEALWRDCLKAGAKVVLDGSISTSPEAGPGDC